MAIKKSISRPLAHIDVAANTSVHVLPLITRTFSTATGIITSDLTLRLLVISGFPNSYRVRL
jgi:hypothetical protein